MMSIRWPRRTSKMTDRLRTISDRLETVSNSTEREFLTLGERLQEIVARAHGQRAAIAGLLESTGQTAGGDIAGVLEEISRRSGEVETAADGVSRFEDLLARVRAVGEPLRGLAEAVRTIRVVGMVTRVESARLGGDASGFDALAGEVARLADAIDERSAGILEAVSGVGQLLVRTRQSAAETERRQQAGIDAMTSECTAGLARVEVERRRVAEVSRALEGRWESFACEIGNLVAALQIHDSTRQRLEHVAEALRAAGAGHEPASESGRLIELQTLQLVQARQAFLDAVDGIDSDLDRLRGIIADCARTAGELSGVAATSGSSFAADLERRLEAIAGTISELAESRRSMAAAGAGVGQACTRMSSFVAEIESVAEQLLRLALNAQIQAVHLAGTGVVMEAVAEGIRASSDTASERARTTGQGLREVEAAADGMNIACGGTDAEVAEAAALAERVRACASRLEEGAGKSAEVLAAQSTESARLAAEIDALRASIISVRDAGEVTGSCISALREIAQTTAIARKTPGNGEVLAEAGRKYTMHAERQAHETFVGVAAPAAGNGGAADSDFGGNVELF